MNHHKPSAIHTPHAGHVIARNALLLTVSMSVTIAVGLYTSRVVLATLGVTDYGVYASVGAIIAMLDFLNSSMSAAASRFLAFERENGRRALRLTFGATMAAHLLIAAAVVAVGESAGLLLLDGVLNIPEGSMHAARVVYQFSILSAVFVILRIPYTSAVIAREKMHIIFCGDLLNATLHLCAVWMLVAGRGDKLILYAGLSAGVNGLLALGYGAVCRRRFDECRMPPVWRRRLLRPILGFSGYELWNSGCSGVSAQGISITVNVAFGVVYNTAVTLCTTAQHAITGLTGTVANAFRPRITAACAGGRWNELNRLTLWSAVTTTALLAAIAGPCIVEADTLLNLWLGNTPPHAAAVMRAILTASLPLPLLTTLLIVIHATARLRVVSIVSGAVYLAIPVGGWLAYSRGCDVTAVYAVQGGAMCLLAAVYAVMVRITTCGHAGGVRPMAYAALTLAMAAIAAAAAGCATASISHGPARLAAFTALYIAAFILLPALVYLKKLIENKKNIWSIRQKVITSQPENRNLWQDKQPANIANNVNSIKINSNGFD